MHSPYCTADVAHVNSDGADADVDVGVGANVTCFACFVGMLMLSVLRVDVYVDVDVDVYVGVHVDVGVYVDVHVDVHVGVHVICGGSNVRI